MPCRGSASISSAPSRGELGERRADVVHLVGDVVHAGAALREELADRRVLAERGQQLDAARRRRAASAASTPCSSTVARCSSRPPKRRSYVCTASSRSATARPTWWIPRASTPSMLCETLPGDADRERWRSSLASAVLLAGCGGSRREVERRGARRRRSRSSPTRSRPPSRAKAVHVVRRDRQLRHARSRSTSRIVKGKGGTGEMSRAGPQLPAHPHRRQGVHQGQRRLLQEVRRRRRGHAAARQVALGLGDDRATSPRSTSLTDIAKLFNGVARLARNAEERGRDDVQGPEGGRASRTSTKRRHALRRGDGHALSARDRRARATARAARSRSTTGTRPSASPRRRARSTSSSLGG